MGVNFVLMTETPSGHKTGPRTHSGFLGGGGGREPELLHDPQSCLFTQSGRAQSQEMNVTVTPSPRLSH